MPMRLIKFDIIVAIQPTSKKKKDKMDQCQQVVLTLGTSRPRIVISFPKLKNMFCNIDLLTFAAACR